MVADLFSGSRIDTWVPLTGSDVQHYFSNQSPGNWRTIEKGALRFNSGNVYATVKPGTSSTDDIYLANLDGTWGMKLFEYADMAGVNDEGIGFVIGPWIMNFGEGRFSWTLVD
jgi:hypothetical protein